MKVGDTVRYLGSNETYFERLVGRTAIVEEVGEYNWGGRAIPYAKVRFKNKRLINFNQENLEVCDAEVQDSR